MTTGKFTGFADLVWSLKQLMHKTAPFIWMDLCQKAVKTLKDILMESPILVYPELNKPYVLFKDALKYALSTVLPQKIVLLVMVKLQNTNNLSPM